MKKYGMLAVFVLFSAHAFARGGSGAGIAKSVSMAVIRSRSSEPITYFKTTWTVPASPATQSGQRFAFWNGLQPSDNSSVLQALLEWHMDGNGRGFWSAVCSNYAHVGGAASKWVRVSSGDVVTAVIELTSYSNGTYDYQCRFSGMPKTVLNIRQKRKLVGAFVALETFNMTQCSDYSGGVTFENTVLHVAGANTRLSWRAYNMDPMNCGVNIGVAGGRVYIDTQ